MKLRMSQPLKKGFFKKKINGKSSFETSASSLSAKNCSVHHRTTMMANQVEENTSKGHNCGAKGGNFSLALGESDRMPSPV